MNVTDFKKHFGLSKPYNFAIALPFLLGLLLLAAVLAVASYAYATDHVSFGSPRFFYFAYLSVTLVLATVLSRRPKISFCLIGLAFIELSLGVTTAYLAKSGAGASVLPRDVVDLRFDYHPLLQGVPTPDFRMDGEHGEIRHNAQGVRGKDITDQNIKKIFIYGGSSTYDIGLGEGETWVEQLNNLLGNGATAVNFGVPGYSTVEHIIQTAFYGDMSGAYPACAVYYIGWNDARNAYIPNLDRGYADFHLPSQLGNMEVRKVLRLWSFSPLFNIASRLLSGVLETAAYPKDLSGVAQGQGNDERFEKIYLNNIQTLSAINRSRNVPTVFIAQIMNPESLKNGGSPGWFPLVKDKDIWNLVDRSNTILGKKAAELHDGFINVGVENFQESDFVDEGHFSPKGAKKFAGLVAKNLKKFCVLPR